MDLGHLVDKYIIDRNLRGVKYFPKCLLPSATFQLAISQLCNCQRIDLEKMK